ncbi:MULTISPECIES: hypothetical protein [unclassified Mesorhizobium]|uniref:hypothetical protein n=1 Tax=unclassified Mesorhizobium TaxID=325217 RepID=UPI000BB09439|nr:MULTISPECIES: hypothetical protein [unclassified Mesorhizobium]TGT63387.1 hypothetical protein EN813_008275 [Mesorhizobium sp. M00.F.Ca.ET.170.01.1.1]AZO11522.1 hypothetical protein EJ074_22300 [Mesorhizobium sp. M3A.F.Ca.ET.080.04.2.1]PBB88214.1 hypothetical protein CK216_00200 [Mesorhizobium sp. WSM3876]RWB67300.1 MAG: hypothetical protein EOQ49_26145 [Mesorhizobium sp.]RWB91976.1 MAG: hypothetical protein EOQ52_00215 [Mesorhizobium sp.]
MKHQTVDQLNAVADVRTEATVLFANRSQRLERWAQLLEQDPGRRLTALAGTEYATPDVREKMRSAGSPMTVAFEDPVFRAQGLKDDSYGEAKRFFELSDWQLHEVVCHCHVGASLPARWAASRVRAAISPGAGFFAWLRGVFLR